MPSGEWHQCHFCGTYVKDGKESNGERHWLSDCRPDLVEHEIGEKCTWSYRRTIPGTKKEDTCYAYENGKHEKFHSDGPM